MVSLIPVIIFFVSIVVSSINCEMLNAVMDISHHNGDVDFEAAKADGIKAVILKATQGATFIDPKFKTNLLAASKAGLLVGAYHFGTGAESGRKQAWHFLKQVGQLPLLVLDLEANPSGQNMGELQAAEFVSYVQRATQRFPMIYGNAGYLGKFQNKTLHECPLWLARYGPKPELPVGWNRWYLWQYTDGKSGPKPWTVKGVGACDRSQFNGTENDLIIFFN